jgi:hypothetical protein
MPSFINKQTTLDLNGPVLSFVQQPSATFSCTSGIATFVGIATATFPTQDPANPATNTGSIAYNWYWEGYGQLIDGDLEGTTVIGAATTTLTLSGISSTILFNDARFFLRADYIPSAYSQPEGSDVTVGTARSTGNAINDPLDSDFATLTVAPDLEIVTQPQDASVATDSSAVFEIEAKTTGTDQEGILYQWQLNGVDLVDGITENFPVGEDSASALLTITDDLGGSSVVNLSTLGSYNGFVTGRTYTIKSNKNLTTRVTASGGGGGTSTSFRSVAGGRGGLSSGIFTFVSDQPYKLIVGGGASGGSAGFGGGGSGSGGGGGGGYTGLFINSVSQTNAIVIAGGGGGGANDPAQGGAGGGLTGGNGGNAGGRGGFGASQSSGGSGGSSQGGALSGASGAGGGGGGYFGGGSGNPYPICCADGAGGGGSGYLHPKLLTQASTTTGGGAASASNGSFNVELIDAAPTSATIQADGTKTPTLLISSSVVAGYNVRCVLTHPTACNSPITSDVASFTAASPLNRAVLEIEAYTPGSSTAELLEFDITSLDYTIDSDVVDSDTICLYAKERDISVEVELYGAKGEDSDYTNPTREPGGEGGYSKLRFTMKKDEEYILKGIKSKTALYLYRKAQLIACVGQGGKGGHYGAGGRGGGVNVAGETGFGRLSGIGGQIIQVGQMSGNGIFGSSSSATSIYSEDSKATGFDGGRTISCTKGVYWRDQGTSACSDLGTVKFRLSNGTEVTNSVAITRGFKDGYGINQTAGTNAGSDGGRGGNGATGGGGGSSGGGGGGSGYTDGSITIVETTLGGNNTLDTKMVLRLFE